jgi:hypothetical protein
MFIKEDIKSTNIINQKSPNKGALTIILSFSITSNYDKPSAHHHPAPSVLY